MEKKESILIIDDNNENLKVAANILKDNNINIYLSNSGEKGIEAAKLKKPDVVIVDLQMPEMDGYEVMRRMKRSEELREIPIVVMTAFTDEENITASFEAGAVDYITKPIKKGELKARVKTQMELARSIKELKAADNMRNKFFSIIAHDLRGPISGMNVLYKMLAAEYDTFDPKEIREIIINTGDTISKTEMLLEELLAWVKTQIGGMSVNKETFDLKRCMDSAIDIVKIGAENKGITIEADSFGEIRAEADYKMIETVIRNLLTNAIKFTKTGGKIEIGAQVLQNNIEIYVEDSGIGMDKKILGELFKVDKMKSLKGTEGEKGSGLGLFICEEFIKLNGGQIRAESELGYGSRFTFTIPL